VKLYNFMIVDDEYLVKVGVKNCIDWHYHGFNEPLEASNANDALEILKRIKMDLIMTDIRMPYKDGFKLIEAIRQMGCDAEVIILSCHNTPEYRHLAEEYGVCAYLFKPKMLPEDIQNAILKAKERIDQKRWKEQVMRVPPTFLEETTKAAKGELLWSILEGKAFTEPDYERYRDVYGLNLDYTGGVVLVLQLMETGEDLSYDEGERISRKILHVLNQECRGETLYRSPSRHVVICTFFGSRMKRSDACRQFAGKLASEISKATGRRIWIGIGGFVDCLSEVRRSYGQAAAAVEQRFFANDRTLLFCEEVLRKGDETQPWLVGLSAARKGIGQSMDELRSQAKDFRFNREEFSEAASMLANEIIKEKHLENIPDAKAQELHLSVFKRIRHAGCSDEVLHFLEELWHDFMWEDNVRAEVNQALGYVKANLGDSNLSLTVTAEKIGLSPNYLGKLFHQSMGKSFTEYLTQLRVEQAQKLLDTTNLKVYEIAEQVGYNDWRYFSKIYKKHTGRTLQQYRVEK